MTFLYGTNMELLYSMPATASTQTASASTCLNTGATSPPFQLPALQNLWSPSSMTGKGLMVVAAGGHSTGANTISTLKLSFDGTAGTSGALTVGTGAIPLVSTTTGAWQAQLWLSCTGVISETSSTWEAIGDGIVGPSTGQAFMWNTLVTAGIPVPLTLPTQTSFYMGLYAQWVANPTVMLCTQFMVFGLN
jgi:hypothetical protein